jgi:predicted phosphodiesterase
VLGLVLGWVVVAVPVTVLVFLNSSRTTVLATHEATVRPTVNGWAMVDLGPFLPSFRYPTGGPLGAEIELGKTSATSYDELVQRYALLASRPEGQIAKVADTIQDLAVSAAIVGGLCGLAVPAAWFLLGARRRRELVRSPRAALPLVAVGTVGLGLVTVAATHPWSQDTAGVAEVTWQQISEALPDVPIPEEAQPLEVDAGLLTQGTKRLVESALDSYRTSSEFYREATDEVAGLAGQVHVAAEGETVAVVVSDRHDNILMDPVASAIAELAGATLLLDAGDDTSTGSSWEAFSIESLDKAFEDIDDRFFVAGNHDHGDFITRQAAELGFTPLEGEVVEGPDDIRLLGVGDPRSSGLGNWRDETGLSFDEVSDRLADAACAADEDGERVSTILVHDADSGAEALARGCADLVVAGHLHEVVGPDAVEADDGRVGYSFTTGTTGGAAYAIAIGTKPRRDATVSLVTYREGRPVGVQTISLSPLGDFTVGRYTTLPRETAAVEPSRSGQR